MAMRDNQEERRWRLENVEAKIVHLEKKSDAPVFGDYAPMVKFVLYIAAAMFVALASGQALNIVGIFK